MVLSAQELFAIEKVATTGMGNKKITTGLAAVDDEAVLAEAPHGGRDGVAQRWATTWCGTRVCVSCLPCISRLASLELRLICALVLSV